MFFSACALARICLGFVVLLFGFSCSFVRLWGSDWQAAQANKDGLSVHVKSKTICVDFGSRFGDRIAVTNPVPHGRPLTEWISNELLTIFF